MKRPPIIVVVGHVNHGKTSLLDYIRKENVVAGEAGGITQSIGAYEITHNGQKMSFIDTPGHEAFMAMRARGARIADIAILVVAADDGVQAQTKEAIAILKETETPFVVAITKIDRVSDTTKAKNDLMQADVLLEGFGGNVSWHAVSAQTGGGINELLDLLIVMADIQDIEYNPAHPARGFVIECKKDNQQGIIVNAIVVDGTLKTGDEISIVGIPARVRSLEDCFGKRVDIAAPSMPITILGFKEMPKIGEEFIAGKGVLENRTKLISGARKPLVKVKGEVVVNIIIKADTYGSLEALSQIVRALPVPPGYAMRVVDEGVGEITDGDIQWLTTSIAGTGILLGFNVKPTKTAENVAKINGIKIITSSIIYNLTTNVREIIARMGTQAIVGDLEILAVFGRKEGRQIVGGKVVAGEVIMNSACGIERNSVVMGIGRIINLQQNKKDVSVVVVGNECGMLIEVGADVDVRAGDHLIVK